VLVAELPRVDCGAKRGSAFFNSSASRTVFSKSVMSNGLNMTD